MLRISAHVYGALSKHGSEVADQLIEVAIRVESVRPFAVETMLSMLLNDSLLLGQVELLQLFPHNILITFHEIFMLTNIN